MVPATARPRMLAGLGLLGAAAAVAAAIVLPPHFVSQPADPTTSGPYAVAATQCHSIAACVQLVTRRLGVPTFLLPSPGSGAQFQSGQVLSSKAEGVTAGFDYILGGVGAQIGVSHFALNCKQMPPHQFTAASPRGHHYCETDVPTMSGGAFIAAELKYTVIVAPSHTATIGAVIDSLQRVQPQ